MEAHHSPPTSESIKDGCMDVEKVSIAAFILYAQIDALRRKICAWKRGYEKTQNSLSQNSAMQLLQSLRGVKVGHEAEASQRLSEPEYKVNATSFIDDEERLANFSCCDEAYKQQCLAELDEQKLSFKKALQTLKDQHDSLRCPVNEDSDQLRARFCKLEDEYMNSAYPSTRRAGMLDRMQMELRITRSDVLKMETYVHHKRILEAKMSILRRRHLEEKAIMVQEALIALRAVNASHEDQQEDDKRLAAVIESRIQQLQRLQKWKREEMQKSEMEQQQLEKQHRDHMMQRVGLSRFFVYAFLRQRTWHEQVLQGMPNGVSYPTTVTERELRLKSGDWRKLPKRKSPL